MCVYTGFRALRICVRMCFEKTGFFRSRPTLADAAADQGGNERSADSAPDFDRGRFRIVNLLPVPLVVRFVYHINLFAALRQVGVISFDVQVRNVRFRQPYFSGFVPRLSVSRFVTERTKIM